MVGRGLVVLCLCVLSTQDIYWPRCHGWFSVVLVNKTHVNTVVKVCSIDVALVVEVSLTDKIGI